MGGHAGTMGRAWAQWVGHGHSRAYGHIGHTGTMKRVGHTGIWA